MYFEMYRIHYRADVCGSVVVITLHLTCTISWIEESATPKGKRNTLVMEEQDYAVSITL
jgi:hypothetical protein